MSNLTRLRRVLLTVSLAFAVPTAVYAHHNGTDHDDDQPAAASGDQQAEAAHEQSEGTYSFGNLTIATPWSRATPPTANVAVGYMTIRNDGDEPDRLIGASSPASGRVEVHTMEISDGVMKMDELPDGLVIPAGEDVSLAPGGLHLMLIDLQKPLVEGELVPVTLQFQGGAIDIHLATQGMGARSPTDDHAGH